MSFVLSWERESSADDTVHAGLSSWRFEKGSQKSNNLQRDKNADKSWSDPTNMNMNASMPSPGMIKLSSPNREFSSRTLSQQRAEKSTRKIRPERSILHGSSNTSDGDTELARTPSRSTSPALSTPEKSFRKVNTILPSPSLHGVKQSERIAARYKSKVLSISSLLFFRDRISLSATVILVCFDFPL